MIYNLGISNIEKFVKAYQERDLDGIQEACEKCQLSLTPGWKHNLCKYPVYDVTLHPVNNPTMQRNIILLYALSTIRDLPFQEYSTHSQIANICKFFSHFQGGRSCGLAQGFSPDRVFSTEGISYFYPHSQLFCGQLSRFLAPYKQNGRYISCGRDLGILASYPVPKLVNGLCEQLKFLGVEPSNRFSTLEGLRYTFECIDLHNCLEYPGFILKLLGEVQKVASRDMWTNMYPRPVEVSYHLQDPKFGELLANPFVQEARLQHGSIHLNTIGCTPMCPSRPNRTAMLWGALLLFVSFFYDVEGNIALVEYTPDVVLHTGKFTSVYEEIKNMIMNLLWAEMWAGFEFDHNLEDIEYGQRIGVQVLQKFISGYAYPISTLLPLWNGEIVKISNEK